MSEVLELQLVLVVTSTWLPLHQHVCPSLSFPRILLSTLKSGWKHMNMPPTLYSISPTTLWTLNSAKKDFMLSQDLNVITRRWPHSSINHDDRVEVIPFQIPSSHHRIRSRVFSIPLSALHYMQMRSGWYSDRRLHLKDFTYIFSWVSPQSEFTIDGVRLATSSYVMQTRGISEAYTRANTETLLVNSHPIYLQPLMLHSNTFLYLSVRSNEQLLQITATYLPVNRLLLHFTIQIKTPLHTHGWSYYGDPTVESWLNFMIHITHQQHFHPP